MSNTKPSAVKARGQHFLVDPRVARKICALLDLEGVGTIVEIGPGRGALTGTLLATGKRVVAVEVDRRLVAYLEQEFGPGLTVVEASILDTDPGALLGAGTGEAGAATRPVLVGNLPYNLSGPILEWIFRSAHVWSEAVVMLQLEVARRLVAPPQTRDFGPLAVACALAFKAQKRFLVRPGAFFPKPKVTSAVVTLQPAAEPPLAPADPPHFLRFVHALFAHRRKNMLNNLELALGLSRAGAEALFDGAGVDGRRRAEQVTWRDLGRLYAALADLELRR